MSALVDPLRDALAGLATIDPGTLSVADLAELVVELRQALTGLEAEHARFVHEAELASVWARDGATSMAAWLATRTGCSVGRAKAEVDLADTLAAVPKLAAAVRQGQVSVENAQVLGSVVAHIAFDDSADDLIEFASTSSPRDLRREVSTWLAAVDGDGEDDRERHRFAKRSLTISTTGDGMVELRGLLTGEDGRIVRNAIDHLCQGQWNDDTGRSHAQRNADALVELASAYARGTVTGGRERPKLLVGVAYETIFERASRLGRLHTGETISGAAARRLACDADLHRVITAGASVTLDFGASTRLATESQYLALVERDGGCRQPGCDRPPSWCDVHHIVPVADGGLTDLDNLTLQCRTHHRFVHELGWTLVGDAHVLRVVSPGGTIHDAPARGRPPTTGAQLQQQTTGAAQQEQLLLAVTDACVAVT